MFFVLLKDGASISIEVDFLSNCFLPLDKVNDVDGLLRVSEYLLYNYRGDEPNHLYIAMR